MKETAKHEVLKTRNDNSWLFNFLMQARNILVYKDNSPQYVNNPNAASGPDPRHPYHALHVRIAQQASQTVWKLLEIEWLQALLNRFYQTFLVQKLGIKKRYLFSAFKGSNPSVRLQA